MKVFFLSASLLTSVAALHQGGYLSQLNGGRVANGGPATSQGPPRSIYSTTPPPPQYPSQNGFAPPSSNTRPPSPQQQQQQQQQQQLYQPPSPQGRGRGGGPSQELLDLWSRQVSVELSASQLYLSASIWFSDRDLKGMSAWMLEESGEERGHGLAILDYARQRKFPVELEALDAPRSDWQNPVQVWEDILMAEETNTQNLLRLAQVADQCGEYGCMAFLNPFHLEQNEAEEKVGSILNKLRRAPQLLVELDHELGMEAAEEEGHH